MQATWTPREYKTKYILRCVLWNFVDSMKITVATWKRVAVNATDIREWERGLKRASGFQLQTLHDLGDFHWETAIENIDFKACRNTYLPFDDLQKLFSQSTNDSLSKLYIVENTPY